MKNLPSLPRLASLALVALLTACATSSEDYSAVKPRPPLDVPPDLSLPQSNAEFTVPEAPTAAGVTYSGYTGTAPQAATPVLSLPKGVRVEGSGTQRWLVINAEPDKVWPTLRAFFGRIKMPLAGENPQTGIMETAWSGISADQALGTDLPGTRSKYRVRLERGATTASTEVFVTHYGVALQGSGKTAVWRLLDPAPERESAMLRQMILFFGTEEKQATEMLAAASTGAKAQLIQYGGGVSVIRIDSDMDNAWRRVGQALDRAGFKVEDRNRSKGLYYVRATDVVKDAAQVRKGWFSRSGGKDDKVADQYQISLKAVAAATPGTEVEVLDAAGAADKSATGVRILELLLKQLN
jgi:outer membrane protein assembly factor BamC